MRLYDKSLKEAMNLRESSGCISKRKLEGEDGGGGRDVVNKVHIHEIFKKVIESKLHVFGYM